MASPRSLKPGIMGEPSTSFRGLESPNERIWRENFIDVDETDVGAMGTSAESASPFSPAGPKATVVNKKAPEEASKKKKLSVKELFNALRGRSGKKQVFLTRLVLAVTIAVVVAVVIAIVSPKMVRIDKVEKSGKVTSKPCIPSSLAFGGIVGAAALGVPYITDFITLKRRPPSQK